MTNIQPSYICQNGHFIWSNQLWQTPPQEGRSKRKKHLSPSLNYVPGTLQTEFNLSLILVQEKKVNTKTKCLSAEMGGTVGRGAGKRPIGLVKAPRQRRASAPQRSGFPGLCHRALSFLVTLFFFIAYSLCLRPSHGFLAVHLVLCSHLTTYMSLCPGWPRHAACSSLLGMCAQKTCIEFQYWAQGPVRGRSAQAHPLTHGALYLRGAGPAGLSHVVRMIRPRRGGQLQIMASRQIAFSFSGSLAGQHRSPINPQFQTTRLPPQGPGVQLGKQMIHLQ